MVITIINNMKSSFLFLIFLTFLIQGCNGQTKTSQKAIYNSDFKWSITIPEDFESVSPEEWSKMQSKGTDAIEKTYETKIVNQAKSIFVFKSGQFNYLESNYQPFDPAKDGDYSESCRNLYEISYQTIKTQMPGVKIDTISAKKIIDNLEFRGFRMIVTYPNNVVLNVLMYSRLFDKKEFTVNILFVDKSKGELMIKAWKDSKFGKE